MSDDQKMPRFTPATPRSRQVGDALRRLRSAAKLTQSEVGDAVGRTASWVGRIEAGDIRARPGDVLELLKVYGVPLDGEEAEELTTAARALRDSGWWNRLGNTISNRYATLIAYEAEASDLHTYEPTLIPGLLQTDEYARVVASLGRETEREAIDRLVDTRMRRQHVITRPESPVRLHAVISEAALRAEVGGTDVLRGQLARLVELGRRPNIQIQVLTFASGAHLADRGGFALVYVGRGTAMGYIETLAGELFLESPAEVERLTTIFTQLKTLALSPAESARMIERLGQ